VVVVDNGSTTSTNGAGCDGCTVADVSISVTWARDSLHGEVTGMGGRFSVGNINAGQVDYYRWSANETLLCGTSKDVVAAQPVPAGAPGGSGTLHFRCGACQ
jgi:hypothetical protein